MLNKKKIVISAINLVEAGPLVILKECLSHLSQNFADQYDLIAMVHDRSLSNISNITYYDFPDSKRSWLRRLYYEYVYFRKFSHEVKPYLWLSLHDITPNVEAKVLAVYCHNSSPFYKLLFKEAIIDPKFALFNIFYKYLYMVNIKKNDFIIVQQNWLRDKFIRLFKLKNVIVSYPNVQNEYFSEKMYKNRGENNKFIFFYPAFPRVFKNFEVICKASQLLLRQGVSNFEVIFTISGSENRYSRNIYNSYKRVGNIKFAGLQDRDRIAERYNTADCLIFPSKLESWGIPITEAKLFMKPLLLANLDYAHETVGAYGKVKFFDPNNSEQLADMMKAAINRTLVFEKTEANIIPEPFSQSWKELFDILLCGNPDISPKYKLK